MDLVDLLSKLLIGIAVTLFLSFLLRSALPRLSKRSKTSFDDFLLNALADSVIPFGLVVILILTEKELGLPINAEKIYDIGLRIIGTVVLIRLVNRVGSRFLNGVARRSGNEDLEQLLPNILPLLKALVWAIGSLVLLQSLGVKMTIIW